MRFNPSLTARLRIGFVLLFALLLTVSLLGVGRLFQIRVNYEDDTSRYFQLELESERLRSAFILEQASVRTPSARQIPSRPEFNAAAKSFAQHASAAADLTGTNTVLTARLERLVAAEASWREAVA
jgi:hypothetical protein